MQTLEAPFLEDVPHGFKYRDFKGQEQYAGPYAKLIKTFASFHNYDLKFDYLDDYVVSRIHRLIENGTYHLSMQPGSYRNQFANISFTYPVEWSKTCIMVPAREELPRYFYVIWPFDPIIWTLLFVCVIYVALVMRLQKHPGGGFATNILNGLAVVLYSPNMNLKVKNIGFRIQFFYSFLLFMGFILSSYYFSYLAVYNMRPVFQGYARTAEDILEANLEIQIPIYIFEELSNSHHLDLTGIERLLVKKPQLLIEYNVTHLDRTVAFVVTQSEWDFSRKLQKNLIQPIYYLSDVCFGNIYNTFPIRENASFARDLNTFILLVHQSGLWKHWENEAFIAAIFYTNVDLLLDDYPVVPLNLDFFRLAWIILIGGYILSCISFAKELIVKIYIIKNK